MVSDLVDVVADANSLPVQTAIAGQIQALLGVVVSQFLTHVSSSENNTNSFFS